VKAPFVSRGDRSGTHAAELRFWKMPVSTSGDQGRLVQGDRPRHGALR
jgi:ABC-type tungstate transport system permease subunit